MTDSSLTVPAPSVPAENTVRCGIDVVSIDRIDRLLAEFEASFRDRVFTQSERAYCENQGDPPQHYAARWAAKEAFLKAVDDEPTVPTRSVGIRRNGGQPHLVLDERAQHALEVTAAGDGHSRIDTAVSLSHDRRADRAVGQVVLLGGGAQ